MKNYIIGIIIGVCLTLTVASVWILIKQNSRLNALEVFSQQVANLINNNNKETAK